MTPVEQLQSIRAELLEELQTLAAELVVAREGVAPAQAAYGAALANADELTALAARGPANSEGMAAALYVRLALARRDALKDLASARGRALAHVKVLNERIAGRELAVRQIDRALASNAEQLPRTVDSSHRKPKVVQFETITSAAAR